MHFKFHQNSKILWLFISFIFSLNSFAIDKQTYVSNTSTKGSFPLASNNKVSALLTSSTDFKGVLKVAEHFQNDIKNVTGITPQILTDNTHNLPEYVVIIGTLGKSPIIDNLVANNKLNAQELTGKWEKFIIQTVKNPFKGVKKALVIAGSDKRGTIYGMYDISNQIGVHPWYFWADVHVKKQNELHILPGIHTKGEPKVKYRGIFINDEAPALTGWAFEKYGGFNAQFYDKVFELILRMKGNYLWPAMWGRMFYVDDPENAKLANEYGIVMGTSHHEPLTRAHAEWKAFGKGEWNFNTNAYELKKFWKEGMVRKGNTEAIVTIGMRGDGDEPMTEGTAIELLENIVKTQREIIVETTQKPIEETPQMWALYKEVQDYYDKGMRVPDDVTLLLCDDNWGNIRKLPNLDAKPRTGGYGIYYHFDYVGGPRNYKWLNTTQIERTWEQMHLAYEYGAKEVWIVNVGDIKPMEFPIEFFLDYAWNPDAWNANNLMEYYTLWSKEVFDGNYTSEIAEIMKKYTKFNARRKPELIDDATYSLHNYNEAETVVTDYNNLAEEAENIYNKLPETYKNAFYELVLFPVKACANLNELYVATAKNHLYAQQGRNSTNQMAQRVQELFDNDVTLTKEYHELNGSKWNHMMSQTHIGYTYWQQPEQNNIPKTETIKVPKEGKIGISIDNSNKWWPNTAEKAVLPTFDPWNNQVFCFEIFNKGEQPFNFNIKNDNDWIQLSEKDGTVENQVEISVQINWDKAPKQIASSEITVEATGEKIPITIQINNPSNEHIKGFVEANGYISIEAKNYSNAVNNTVFNWVTIPNLGKTSSGVTPMPTFVVPQKITNNSPRLEYNLHLFTKGTIKVHAYFSPTINYTVREGLKYGVGIDNETPQIVTLNEITSGKEWENSVANNVKVLTTTHQISETGNHVLKFYMVDTGLVLQKIVIDTGNLKDSYLGPPQSVYVE